MPSRKPISETDRRLIRQIRVASIVIAATMILWIGAQFLGGRLGWPPRLAFLFDLAAIAALVWALVVTYWVWQARRSR